MGVVIRGVTVGPSPEWLVRRLEAIGSRSINNVVDASNYVLHELGQPTHAFDLAKLAAPAIVVRRASAGETITTLDGTERALRDDMIVIADAKRPQAIAGVMGGRDSEVTDATTDIFLEVGELRSAANSRRPSCARPVDRRELPVRARRRRRDRTARARARGQSHRARSRAGVSTDPPVDLAYARRQPPTESRFARRAWRVCSATLSTERSKSYLRSVGFDADRVGDDFRVAAPTWRGDVTSEADLIEEVARLRGYDSFPIEIRPFRVGRSATTRNGSRRRGSARRWWARVFSKRVRCPSLSGGEGFVRLTNPLSEAEAYLRRDILDTLARRAEYNLARMQGMCGCSRSGRCSRRKTVSCRSKSSESASS